MSNGDVEVAIIGGGVGGLATAVALNHAGIDAHVYEQAEAYSDIGGHLNIDEAAIAVLARWGLEDGFRKIACCMDGIQMKRLATGDDTFAVPFLDIGSLGVDDNERVGARICSSFLRADLLALLVDNIPKGNIHIHHRLEKVENRGDRAVATFDNGNEVSASILIAADGVKSVARRLLDDVLPTPAYYSILRTMCRVDKLPDQLRELKLFFWDGSEFGDIMKGEPGVALLTVPVRDGEFLSIDLQLQGGDLFDDCNPHDIPVERVMARYPDTIDPSVLTMIEERVEPIAAYPLFDRPVAETWVEGRIALLGDAAHSMRPNLGQGACQSIHDAGAIADAFAKHGVSHEALKAFEAKRKPYTQSVVEAARKAPTNPKAYVHKVTEL